ncbi:hypothetical protein [Ruegeria sp. HKCCD4318-2]|uniref:hypothetical protein n=1 Tax=Ruegeria sp. HKCCD4318-2 TaxID=2683020 RepID=UPI001491EA9C|nr:hypothetical protein [Ruegeria sp. HKCCD4318-2]
MFDDIEVSHLLVKFIALTSACSLFGERQFPLIRSCKFAKAAIWAASAETKRRLWIADRTLQSLLQTHRRPSRESKLMGRTQGSSGRLFAGLSAVKRHKRNDYAKTD